MRHFLCLFCFAVMAGMATQANAALISGTVASIDQDKGKLTLETTGGKSQTFQITGNVTVTLDGKPAKLSQVEAGQKVSVFTSATGRVEKLTVRSGTPAATPPANRPKTGKPASEPIETPEAAQTGWYQYGGPNRDNISTETGLLAQWPESGPQLKWTTSNLGEGYSSVALADDGKMYTMGNRGDQEMTICLDSATGKEIWATQTGKAYREGQGNGPRGTPTIDGDRVYVLGGNGDFSCLKRQTGAPLFSGNILQEFGARNIVWGISESVFIDGDKAVFTPGGQGAAMVAINKLTGKLIWKAAVPGNPQTGYSSIIPVEVGGVRQYVNFVHTAVIGVDAQTGQFLWANESAANGTANCSSPISNGEYVFAASGYGTGGTLIQLTGGRGNISAQQVYHTQDMKSHHGGMVLYEGHIYATDEQILKCLDFKTGEVKWQNRSVGKGSVVFADGHVILRSENGPVAMFAATPDGYHEQGRFEPPRSDRPAWPHPVVASGCLFLRDQDRLFCYELK